jgi:hypothetical protein
MLLKTKNSLSGHLCDHLIDFMPCGASVIAVTYQVMLNFHAAV